MVARATEAVWGRMGACSKGGPGVSKGQKKQKTTGKIGWRSKKANHGRKPGMGRGKRN